MPSKYIRSITLLLSSYTSHLHHIRVLYTPPPIPAPSCLSSPQVSISGHMNCRSCCCVGGRSSSISFIQFIPRLTFKNTLQKPERDTLDAPLTVHNRILPTGFIHTAALAWKQASVWTKGRMRFSKKTKCSDRFNYTWFFFSREGFCFAL